jgi:hypothetical protein
VGVLGKFLNSKDANVKYLALETLSRLALVGKRGGVLQAAQQQEGQEGQLQLVGAASLE